MRTDRASRTVRAAPGAVWDALIDPDALAKWLPPDGMTGEVQAFESKPGGRFRMVLRYVRPGRNAGKTTADSDVVEGRFAALVPGERMVWTIDFVSDDPALAGTMRMTWRLAAVAEGTRVDIVCENVPDGIAAEDHAIGLAASLANLAAWVERVA